MRGFWLSENLHETLTGALEQRKPDMNPEKKLQVNFTNTINPISNSNKKLDMNCGGKPEVKSERSLCIQET